MDTLADRGDCRQGPCKPRVRNAGECKRRPNPHFHLAATQSMKLDGWSSAQDQTPHIPGSTGGFNWNSGAGGGVWIKAPSVAVPPVDYYGYADDDTESNSPRGRGAPNVARKLVIASRDKESLLEEIVDLKKALAEQAQHLKLHKVHACSVELENRKLEKDVEDLENCGSGDGPRTGGITRLRAKIQGLKTRCGDLQSTCDAQHEEIALLRRDIRVTRTREIEVERDVFAGEIARLQKLIKRMKGIHNRISCENRELGRLKDKSCRLEMANARLESCISVVHKTLERANREVTQHRHKAREASLQAKKHEKRCKELEDHAALLEGLLEQERIEKRKLQKRIHDLEEELAKLAREKETRPNSRSDLQSRGGPVGESWGFDDDKGGWSHEEHHKKHKKVHHHHDSGGGLFSGFFGGGSGGGSGGGKGGGKGDDNKDETDAASARSAHSADPQTPPKKQPTEKGHPPGGAAVKGGVPKLKLDGLEGKEGKAGDDKFHKDSKAIPIHDKNARGLFDKNKKEMHYDTETKPIPKDKDGRPLFDKDGNPLFYDKNGNLIKTDKDGRPLFDKEGRPLFDKDGNPITYDRAGNVIPFKKDAKDSKDSRLSSKGSMSKPSDRDEKFDKDAKPIPLNDRDSRALFDGDHQPITYDNQNMPIPRDKAGKLLFAKDGSPLFYDKFGNLIPTDKDGNPLFDAEGRPLFDKDENPIYYDKNGNPIDKFGNLLKRGSSKSGAGKGFGEGYDQWGNKLGSAEAERKKLEELMREKDKYHITVNDTQIEKNEFEFDKDREGNVSIDISLKSPPGEPSDSILSAHELELLAKHKEVAKSTGSLIEKHLEINDKTENLLLSKHRKLNKEQEGVLEKQIDVAKTMENILEKHKDVAKAIEKEITSQEVKAAFRASRSEQGEHSGKKVSIRDPSDRTGREGSGSEGGGARRKSSKKGSKYGLHGTGGAEGSDTSHDGHSSDEGGQRKSISHTGTGGDPHRKNSKQQPAFGQGHGDPFARGKARFGQGTSEEDDKFATDTKQRISVREDMAPERLGGHGEEYLDLPADKESLDDIKKAVGGKNERHSFDHLAHDLAGVHDDVKDVLHSTLDSLHGEHGGGSGAEGHGGHDGSGEAGGSGGVGSSGGHDEDDSSTSSGGGSGRKKPGHTGANVLQLGIIKENMKEVLEHLDTIKGVLVHRKDDDPPEKGYDEKHEHEHKPDEHAPPHDPSHPPPPPDS